MLWLCLLALTSLASASMRTCGEGTATVTGFGGGPERPKVGDNETLWVAYDLTQPITGGKALYDITLNYVPFPTTTEDLCTQTTCPKPVGTYNETSWSIFSGGVSGTIKSKITWKDQNDALVWCVETTLKV